MILYKPSPFRRCVVVAVGKEDNDRQIDALGPKSRALFGFLKTELGLRATLTTSSQSNIKEEVMTGPVHSRLPTSKVNDHFFLQLFSPLKYI